MTAAVAAINFGDDTLIATTAAAARHAQHNCHCMQRKTRHAGKLNEQHELAAGKARTAVNTKGRANIPTNVTTAWLMAMQHVFIKSLTAVAALATTGTTAAAAAAATYMQASLPANSSQDNIYNFSAGNNVASDSSAPDIHTTSATHTAPSAHTSTLLFVATTAVTSNNSNKFAYEVTDNSATNNHTLFIEPAVTTSTAKATIAAASTLTLTSTASATATASATTTINATLTTVQQQHDELVEWSHFYDLILSWKGISLIAVFCIFIIITIIGNTLVILAVITTRRLKTVTNCFVMSLAVADLLVGIFVMPPAVAVHLIGSWQLGWVLCDIWISLDVLLCTASILSLCAISVDRYLAVTRPLSYSRKRRSKRLALVMILIVWLLALAITCPPMLGWYEPGRRDLKECRYNQNEGYVIFSAMGSFFIPMMVMIYVYARISCVIASRHDNMTDISVHNKKFKRYTSSDVDNDIDNYLSEQELHIGHKKQLPVRTFSNQTIAKELHEILRDDDAADDADDAIVHIETLPRTAVSAKGTTQSTKNNHKNGCYELTRPASLRRTPIIVTTLATANTTPVHSPHKSVTTTTTATTTNSNNSCLRYHAGVYTNPQHQQYIRVHSFRQHHLSAPAATNAGSLLDSTLSASKQQMGRVHQHHHHHNSKSLSNRITSLKKENKTTQTLSIVVGGFIACWLPFFIYYLITPFLPKNHQNETLAKGLTWLGWFNSAINPFIYAFYSVDFRAAFWRLTCKRFFNVTPAKQQFQTNTMSIRR